MLQRLQQHGLLINVPKSVFGVPELDFLGHHVSSEDIRPLNQKVQAVLDFPQPPTHRKLREFLGLINFYHRFIPQCAAILKPLNSCLVPKGMPLSHGTMLQPLHSPRSKMRWRVPHYVLVHPEQNAPTCIMTGASEVAVGAVLQQHIQGQWCPNAYFSKALKPAETRYSTFDRELLAIYLPLKHFRYFIEGCVFYVLMDHNPLHLP